MVGLETAAQLATVIGAPLGILALVYAGRQLSHSVAVARGEFMLELENMSGAYDSVHARLRPGGDWAEGDKGPASVAEWIEVEDYMGFFEHCELLLRTGSLDIDSFKAVFGYRIDNIMKNRSIVEAKLIRRPDGWTLFLELLDRLGVPRPEAA